MSWHWTWADLMGAVAIACWLLIGALAGYFRFLCRVAEWLWSDFRNR